MAHHNSHSNHHFLHVGRISYSEYQLVFKLIASRHKHDEGTGLGNEDIHNILINCKCWNMENVFLFNQEYLF